jgi:DNA repair exonuclease SbcCD nuclease subunit
LYVEGNHEKTDPPWLASLNDDKFVHLNSKGYYKHGCSFYGIDYVRSRDDMLSRLSEISSTSSEEMEPSTASILVMHAGFQHMINFEGASVVSASDIPDGIDQVLVGHIHKRKTAGKIHSPGPLFPQNWEEVGPCYVDMIVTSNHGVTITPLDVTVREYHTFSITDVPEHIPNKSELPTVVRVTTSNHRDVIPAIDGCIVIPKVVGMVKESSTEIAVSSKTIEEAIMEEYDDPSDGVLMYELYKSDDPKEVINKLFNQHNIERRKLC